MRPNHARHTTAARWQPADSQQSQEKAAPGLLVTMTRLAVAHLFAVSSARAAGGPSAWTRCAGENGTCHCPGGAVRLGWARRDLWGPPVATRLASDGVNHGATTCAEARVPAPGGGSLARGRRSCQCTNAEPLRAVTSAWTARKNTVCTPPAAAACDADVRRRVGRHLRDLNGAVRATAAAACGPFPSA